MMSHGIHGMHGKGLALVVLGMMIGGVVNAATVTATTDAFRLSIKHDGVRESAGDETLTYSSRWDGGDGATVTIAQDGTALVQNLSGEGERAWNVRKTGTYTLSHTTYTNGVAGKVETATFVVPGPELTFEYDGGQFVGGTLTINGNLDGWTIYYTLDGSTPTTESDKYTGPFTLSAAATVKAFAVSGNGLVTEVLGKEYAVVEHARIENVRARQRWPWNGKVDIDFDVVGDVTLGMPSGTGIVLLIMATNRVDGTNYVASIAALSGDTDTAAGTHRVTWDLNAQGLNFTSADVVFSVGYAKYYRYCIVDLSAGANAASYPVTYTSEQPAGGFNTDEYKTTKLVLRLIEPGSFKMGGEYDVTLTKPYYMGIFEMTQKQYELVMGDNPSSHKGDNRPVESVSYNAIRGAIAGDGCPVSSVVDGDAFLGKLRAKTGVVSFDLPTEAQWEYACRAGTTSTYNNGGNNEADLKLLGRYSGNQSDGRGGYSQHATVGSYAPNDWGLYDMHGNVWEWCLDWYGSLQGGNDPKGASSGSYRIIRGGGWFSDAGTCASSNRNGSYPSLDDYAVRGFRLSCSAGLVASATSPQTSVSYVTYHSYCVVDLSVGANAANYPVSYTSEQPVGGFNTDEYKTTKLVLHLINPGSFKMCGQYDVTLSKPFYCGLFEVTQKQYELVTGSNPSSYKGDMRPVECVSWDTIRGTYNWPESLDVDANSFVGRIQSRTGLAFDLPTEAQWEYACRAGTTSTYNNGGDTEDDLKLLGRYSGNQSDGKGGYSQHTTVGLYCPNAWGLYDMHGNVAEFCLDGYGSLQSGVTDPKGSAPGGWARVYRGGYWSAGSGGCTSSHRMYYDPGIGHYIFGFRLVRALSSIEGASIEGEHSPDAVTGVERVDTLCSGDSEPVVIDSRISPRASLGDETLTYSSLWDGGDGATVTIAQDGVAIAEGLTGEDAYAWGVTRNGTYVLTHTTYTNGVAGAVETATFVVTGKDVPFAQGDVTVTGYSEKYDGAAHGITVASEIAGIAYKYASGAVGATSPTGEWSIAAPTLTDVGAMTVWVEISAPGYITQTNSATVKIAKREVTLTSGSDSKVYDGTVLVKHDVTVGDDGFTAGEGATYDYTGSQTPVGTSENTFTYTLNAGTLAGNYTISTVNGTLTVTKATTGDGTEEPGSGEVPTGGESKFDVTAMYDGEGHTIDTNALVAAFGAAMIGEGAVAYAPEAAGGGAPALPWLAEAPVYTNVGEYVVWYKVSNPNYNDFMHAAKVTVTNRPVTVTSADGGWTYDGLAHSNATVTCEGFVSGEGIVAGDFVEIVDVGTAANAFGYSFADGTLAGNYLVTCVTGTLTVAAADMGGWTDDAKWSVALSGDGAMYDGTEKTCAVTAVAYDGFAIPTFTVTGNTATDAGDYTLTVTGTGNFSGSHTFPWSIVKRTVTLTSGSDNKVYDGTALVKHEVAVGGDGFADGEGAVATYTGSQTTVGESENTFTYTLNDGTKAGNYTITTVNGALTVTKASVGPGGGDEPGDGEVSTGGASRFDVTAMYDAEGHTIETNALVAAFGAAMIGESAVAYAPEAAGDGAPDLPWLGEAPVYTNVGEYVVWYKVTNPNYEDFTHAAKVTITNRPVTVAITGHTATYTYDTTEKSVSGYEATTADALYDIAADTAFGGVAVAKRTDVGIAQMGLKAEDFANNNANFAVTYLVTDGWVEITSTREMDELVDAFDGLPVTVAPDGAGGWTVKVTNDIDSADLPIEIPDNLGKVTIDLNGHDLSGADGADGDDTTPGGAGQPAIVIVSGDGEGDPTELSIVTTGGDAAVKGGDGGDGNPGGNGAPAIAVADDANDGVLVNVGEGVTVRGGDGGASDSGDGGNGGAGIAGNVGTNDGTIIGGSGGSSVSGDGGNGGPGVDGNVDVNNGAISGGASGGSESGEHGSHGEGVTGEVGTDNGVILPYALADEMVGQVAGQPFTGAEVKPVPDVYDSVHGRDMVEGVDYALSWKDNVWPGTASVTVTGIGDYVGLVTRTFTIGTPVELTLKAGEYFKATLAELGYDVPTDGTPYSVVAKGLPAGLKLKYNAAWKNKKGKVVIKAKSEWWIEGVPTAALDFFTNPPYLVITVNGVAKVHALPIEVLPQEVVDLGELALGQTLDVQDPYRLPGVTNGWTVTGLPKGLKYTAKRVTEKLKSGKKKIVVTKAQPYSVYGKTTKAGLFTITAKKKVGAFYETMKYRVLVRPKAVDTALFGEDLTNITTMAYVPINWDLAGGVPPVPFVPSSIGGNLAKVTGLPTGLTFAAKDAYAYTNAKKKKGKYLKQKGQTIVGTPTKPGTYVVTFTKNVKSGKKTVARTAQILWVVTQNDAELSLGFNNIGGVVESGVVGLKYADMMAFAATSNATVTASGLPAGIKLANLGGGNYAFTGFTAKAGTYLVTVKATLNGKTVTQRVALKVDALPAWAKGTFNGYVAGEDGATNGLATVTVSAAGKVSGKFYDRGTNWTFTAASYTAAVPEAASYSEFICTNVVAKFAYKVTEKVKGKKKTVTKYVTRSFTLTVGDDALGGTATLVENGGDTTVRAWQNLWGSTYKALGKKLFSSKSGKKTLAYRTFAIKSTDPAGEAMGLLPTETLSLKVTTAGAVTATMSFGTGKKSKGKAVIYKATCSTVVIPLTEPTATEFEGFSCLYFAPSMKNNFPGFAAAVPF